MTRWIFCFLLFPVIAMSDARSQSAANGPIEAGTVGSILIATACDTPEDLLQVVSASTRQKEDEILKKKIAERKCITGFGVRVKILDLVRPVQSRNLALCLLKVGTGENFSDKVSYIVMTIQNVRGCGISV